MSRVGKKPIDIPQGVTVAIEKSMMNVKGPKGEIRILLPMHVTVSQEGAILRVAVSDPDNKDQRSLWGTIASIARNAVKGVTQGFQKQLEIQGTGFKAAVAGGKISLSVGFSHPVEYAIPQGAAAAVEKNIITITGIDRQIVGEVAAQLRSIRPPDVYKGKGIRYAGEQIKLKPGKQAKTATAA
jgi:large subunit ribosomal protein L6